VFILTRDFNAPWMLLIITVMTRRISGVVSKS